METRERSDGSLLAQRFELRDKLGEGGMGVVHRAWDRVLGLEVALKRIHGVGAAGAHAIKAEFRARSALQHRGIVQLYELVVDGDDCFLTMELVEGTDLASWVRGVEAEAASPGEPEVTRPTRPLAGDTPSPFRPRVAPIDHAGSLRLRAVLVELCSALAVLHEAGVVHRDLSPANVRVAPGGRVVVLDFGLAGYSGHPDSGSDDVVVGTPVYMAPEQVRAEPVTPAADLYAVGAMMYELLAGRAPFVGSEELIAFNKRLGSHPAPLGYTADDELAALALELLAPLPASRPDARAALARLSRGKRPSMPPTFGTGGARGFFGRGVERARLDGALARVIVEGQARAVIVEGASGIGKSTLLRHFLAEVPRRHGKATVLASRCHPQETVPFKAVDAAIEALAERARTMDDLPPLPAELARAVVRLFPALSVVAQLAGADDGHDDRGDESERRAQGFEGLRQLLAGFAARGPLVLAIDDVQWDDSDSLALLEAVLRPRGGPALLLVLAVRSDGGGSATVRRLLAAPPLVPVERLELGALTEPDASVLAAVFLGERDPRIAEVVSQCGGNPFLVCELARHRAAHGEAQPDVDVKGLVGARLGELAPAERAVLEAASLALGPLLTSSALEAVGLGPDALPAVLALRDAYLVKLDGETLTPYHDKIAEATRELLSAERTREVHRGLAGTLERHAPERDDGLCVHWEGAGETTRAATHAFRAAEHAMEVLAFAQASEHFDKALALGFTGVPRATLLARAADALAHQGVSPLAAARYLEASRALGGDIADARVRTLTRLAAEQYVKGGYVSRGWQVMRSVLDAAGIPQPASARAAMLGSLGRRLRFLVRRFDAAAIGARTIPAEERPRLEILWTASTSMSMVDVTLSDDFRTQHLARILDVGDASSIARALAYEAALEAHVGGPLFDRHLARLLAHARELVARTGDPYDQAWLELGHANQAYCAGNFAEAVAACERSQAILRDRCTGVAWELSTVAAFHLTSLAMIGDLVGLRAACARLAADAERRGDLFGLAEALTGECVLAWWSQGSGDAALTRARDAVARQGGDADRWPEKTYRRSQMTELMGTVHLRLVAADPAPAWRMLLEQWPAMERAMLPSLQFYRSWLRHGRARVALAGAARGGLPGWSRAQLLADATRLARELRKDRKPFAAPWAALVDAGLAQLTGKDPAPSLERALVGFDRAGMALYREATRWRLAGGRETAEAWMRGQGVRDFEGLVRGLVPGF